MLFLSGVVLLLGVRQTFRFFYRKGKIRGAICFLGGIILVLFRWPILGMCIEMFGIFNLFG